MKHVCFKAILLSLFMLFQHPSIAASVVYPGHERNDYVISVLKLALSSHYQDDNYEIHAYGKDIPKIRAFELMANNSGIDVIFGGATPDREANYQPIRFPLFKGLYGWRISLIHQDNSSLFSTIDNLEKLKTIKAGQFHSWSDTKVLLSNELNVVAGSDHIGLYKMLHSKRFDYFPRSVLEVVGDYQAFEHLNIAIDPHAIIHYPAAYYIYVRKGNDTLASAIKYGLERALKDGALDKLFNQYYGDVINRIKSEKRHVIKLKNPRLSSKTPLDRKELWIDLGSN